MEQNIKCQSKILNPAIISYTNEDEIKTKNKQNQTYTTRNVKGSSSGLRKKWLQIRMWIYRKKSAGNYMCA